MLTERRRMLAKSISPVKIFQQFPIFKLLTLTFKVFLYGLLLFNYVNYAPQNYLSL